MLINKLKVNHTEDDPDSNPQVTFTGNDGFTYDRGFQQVGAEYQVEQTIPGILQTGYYRINWEGGA